MYGELLTATSLTLRATSGHFPAYRFHLAECLNDEWLSMVDWHKPFHRDHMSHQIMCYYIAQELLNAPLYELSFGGCSLRQICIDHIMNAPSCEYLRQYAYSIGLNFLTDLDPSLRQWVWNQLFDESIFLACFFHDIGYPWQFLNTIAKQLATNGPSHTPALHGLSEIYDAFKKRLVLYPLNGYSPFGDMQPADWTDTGKRVLKMAFSQTHGMPGAISFLHLNDILREYPVTPNENACGRFCLEWAAMGILMHDMASIYRGAANNDSPPDNPHLRLKISRDPLSFVVTLVDQIQDFGRANAVFEKATNHVTLSYDTACTAVDLSLSKLDHSLEINYEYHDLEAYINNTSKFKPKAEKEYFNINTGFLDWSDLPVSHIHLATSYVPRPHKRNRH